MHLNYVAMHTIPAVKRKFSDQQVMEIALIENVQREDLNAIEIALAYQAIMDQVRFDPRRAFYEGWKIRSHIANFLRLLKLPDQIKENVSRGTLSMGHARALVGVKDDVRKKELAEHAIANEWSVRDLEEAIQKLDQQVPLKTKPTSKKRDPYIEELEETLRGQFKTTVKIKQQKDKGKIRINVL